MRKTLKILIHGTRGKSSLIRFLHQFFIKKGYEVISRETGLDTIIYENEKIFYLEREKRYSGMRAFETSLVISEFFLKGNKYDIMILENNTITLANSILITKYFKPDILIITTWDIDHLEAQGYSTEDTFNFYLKGMKEYIPRLTIFWTNFKEEYNIAKKILDKEKSNLIKLRFSTLSKRNYVILKEISNLMNKKFRNVKVNTKETERNFGNVINIGDINDPKTCLYWLEKNIKDKKDIVFLLNLRCDRKDRTLSFLEIVLPSLPKKYEKIAFVEDFVTKTYCRSKGIKKIFTKEEKIMEYIKKNNNKTFVMLTNTTNPLGDIIRKKSN